jgi:hypothetical protein
VRLIDADALLSDIERTIVESGCVNHEGEIMDCVRYASEVDAVPVVRCGECDRRIKSADLTNTVLCGWLHKITMNKDDFCSYGAKMEDKP